jgi:hypothetical protein
VSLDRVLPPVQVFAGSLTALVGLLLVFAVGRSRRPDRAVPGLMTTVAMLTGSAFCVALFAYVALRYPAATRDPSHVFSVLFAVVLSGYVWLALAPPRVLAASRSARRTGTVAALAVFGLGYPLVASQSYDGQLVYLLAGLFLVIPGLAMAVAAVGGTRRRGVEAAVWMGLISGLSIFVVHLILPLLGFQIDAALADEGYLPSRPPDLGIWLPEMLGRELGGGIFALLLLPGWALFFGLVGGEVGQAVRRARDAFREGMTA